MSKKICKLGANLDFKFLADNLYFIYGQLIKWNSSDQYIVENSCRGLNKYSFVPQSSMKERH